MRVTPLTGIALATALLAVGAWAGASLVTSPREAALKAAAPPPSVITAQVEARPVAQEVVTRGTVLVDRTVEAIGSAPPEGATVAVLSRALPERGSTLKAGEVAAEISGRPVFVLTGTVPMYRALGPGAVGPDVKQLQAGLRELGNTIADDEGTFGNATLAAVTKLYKDAGYPLAADGIPVGEVVFLPGFPATVTAANGAVGTDAADAQLTLASGRLSIVADFPTRQRMLLAPGDPVVVSSELLGEETTATIGSLDVPGEDGATVVEILPDEPLASDWAGQGVRVRVVTESSSGEVLAVPVGAVFLGQKGISEVVLVDGDSQSRVAVTVGVVGGGYAEVASDDPALAAGATVLLSVPPAS
ncbi:MAG: hypothetical protein QM713_02970 [Arachnia sp.]